MYYFYRSLTILMCDQKQNFGLPRGLILMHLFAVHLLLACMSLTEIGGQLNSKTPPSAVSHSIIIPHRDI